jgi:hypothetical protein
MGELSAGDWLLLLGVDIFLQVHPLGALFMIGSAPQLKRPFLPGLRAGWSNDQTLLPVSSFVYGLANQSRSKERKHGLMVAVML